MTLYQELQTFIGRFGGGLFGAMDVARLNQRSAEAPQKGRFAASLLLGVILI